MGAVGRGDLQNYPVALREFRILKSWFISENEERARPGHRLRDG